MPIEQGNFCCLTEEVSQDKRDIGPTMASTRCVVLEIQITRWGGTVQPKHRQSPGLPGKLVLITVANFFFGLFWLNIPARNCFAARQRAFFQSPGESSLIWADAWAAKVCLLFVWVCSTA